MELESLVQDYRNGDRSVRDIIIKELMPIAEGYGKILSSSFGYRGFKAQELISEAYCILVDLVDEADQKLQDNNITGYIKFYLPKRLRDFMWDDCVVVVPSSTHKLQNVGRAKIEPIFEQYKTDASESKVRDLLEDIDRIIQNEDERKFIAYRMAGYQNTEIAQMMGTYPVNISRMRTELERRYNLICT